MDCAWSAPSHYMNQCWLVICWTPGTNLSEIWIQILFFSWESLWKCLLRNGCHCVQDMSSTPVVKLEQRLEIMTWMNIYNPHKFMYVTLYICPNLESTTSVSEDQWVISKYIMFFSKILQSFKSVLTYLFDPQTEWIFYDFKDMITLYSSDKIWISYHPETMGNRYKN